MTPPVGAKALSLNNGLKALTTTSLSPQLNPLPAPACKGLSHYPSDTVDGSLGAFGTRSPLAKPGPSSTLFWAGWGQWTRDWSLTGSEVLDDVIGAICVFALPAPLLFLEFLQ